MFACAASHNLFQRNFFFRRKFYFFRLCFCASHFHIFDKLYQIQALSVNFRPSTTKKLPYNLVILTDFRNVSRRLC